MQVKLSEIFILLSCQLSCGGFLQLAWITLQCVSCRRVSIPSYVSNKQVKAFLTEKRSFANGDSYSVVALSPI